MSWEISDPIWFSQSVMQTQVLDLKESVHRPQEISLLLIFGKNQNGNLVSMTTQVDENNTWNMFL